jgi:hypothetical protein
MNFLDSIQELKKNQNIISHCVVVSKILLMKEDEKIKLVSIHPLSGWCFIKTNEGYFRLSPPYAKAFPESATVAGQSVVNDYKGMDMEFDSRKELLKFIIKEYMEANK